MVSTALLRASFRHLRGTTHSRDPNIGTRFVDINVSNSILTTSKLIPFGEELNIEARDGSGEYWYRTHWTAAGTKGAVVFGFSEYPNLHEETAELGGNFYFITHTAFQS